MHTAPDARARRAQASGAITNLAAGHYDNKARLYLTTTRSACSRRGSPAPVMTPSSPFSHLIFTQGRIADAGGLPVLIAGLTKHKADSAVSEQARPHAHATPAAAHRLSQCVSESWKRVAHATDRHAPLGKPQICAALANLGTHEQNPKKASRAGALPAIVTVMLENPKSATLQVRVDENLSRCDLFHSRIHIRFLGQVSVKAERGVRSAQAHCSRAIASLTWHDDDIKREAREVRHRPTCSLRAALDMEILRGQAPA